MFRYADTLKAWQVEIGDLIKEPIDGVIIQVHATSQTDNGIAISFLDDYLDEELYFVAEYNQDLPLYVLED